MKSRPDYLPAKALLLAGEIMAMNEGKHPGKRWKTITPEEHVGAILRHILSWLSGDKIDGETGKSHLTHALCRCAMAVEREMESPKLEWMDHSLPYTEPEIKDGLKAWKDWFQDPAKNIDFSGGIGNPPPPGYAIGENTMMGSVVGAWEGYKDRVRYTHVEEAPLPACVNPELEAYHKGELPLNSEQPKAPEIAEVGDWIEIIKDEGGAPEGALHKVLYSDNSHVDFKRGEGWCWASHDSYKIYHLPTKQPKAPEQGIDSIKPAQWDNMNREFLDSHMNDLYRYAVATHKQSNGDDE